MKNILIISLLLTVLFSCKKDDIPASSYSEKQQKAFAIFSGTWADIQFSNLGGGILASAMPDPDKIVFGEHNSTQIDVTKSDYMNGTVHLFYNQGKCTYHEMLYKGAQYEITECFYEVSDNADKLTLYKQSDNSLFLDFDMSIQSETKMNLWVQSVTLPYVFVKQ